MKIAALVIVAIATVTDLRTHKIPNKLTFPASAIGIIAQAIYFASWSNSKDVFLQLAAGFVYGILGWFMGVFVMSFIKFFLRHMGHGDTKLVAAVGTFLGPWMLLMVIMYYSFAYGIFSTFKLLQALNWWQVASNVGGADLGDLDMQKVNKVRKQIIPVAPLIAIGTLLAILLEQPTLEFFGFHD